MKHLYQNHSGEIVAADSKFEAAKHHDMDLGGEAARDIDVDDWDQIADDGRIPARDEDGTEVVTKTAAEWAAECPEPILWSTTYV